MNDCPNGLRNPARFSSGARPVIVGGGIPLFTTSTARPFESGDLDELDETGEPPQADEKR